MRQEEDQGWSPPWVQTPRISSEPGPRSVIGGGTLRYRPSSRTGVSYVRHVQQKSGESETVETRVVRQEQREGVTTET